MKFMAAELITELTQDITISERTSIYSIAPYLLKVGTVAGGLKLSITSGGNELFTKSLLVTEIVGNGGITADNHFHGFINFDHDCILDPGTYTIKLEPTGAYTFSQSAWWGWIIDHEDEIYFNQTVNNDCTKPYKLKVFAYEY